MAGRNIEQVQKEDASMRKNSLGALATFAALTLGGAAALAQGTPHHGGHGATPTQAAPGQTPPSADQMQQMMGMMGRMTPEQMQQMYQSMRQRMTPEQHAQMMQGMGHGNMGHGGMSHGAAPAQRGAGSHDHDGGTAAASSSTAAFLAANEKMHREMAVQFTGNADRDFAAAMIPHHQGAIEMARIQIQYGRDPEMRRIAEAVVREQEREIAELRAFLQRPTSR